MKKFNWYTFSGLVCLALTLFTSAWTGLHISPGAGAGWGFVAILILFGWDWGKYE